MTDTTIVRLYEPNKTVAPFSPAMFSFINQKEKPHTKTKSSLSEILHNTILKNRLAQTTYIYIIVL